VTLRDRLCLAGLLWVLCALATAQATTFEFASVAGGRAVVTARDDYIVRLSALERALKAKSTTPVSEARFVAIAAAGVRAWSGAERERVEQALAALRQPLAELNLPLPDRVLLVRASGAGEGGAAHTRGHAIVLTDEALRTPARLPFLLAHELFHIASRHDPAWRDTLYGAIGFVPIEGVVLSPDLAERRITNPDAPKLDVALHAMVDGNPSWVTPLLLATVERYDPASSSTCCSWRGWRSAAT